MTVPLETAIRSPKHRNWTPCQTTCVVLIPDTFPDTAAAKSAGVSHLDNMLVEASAPKPDSTTFSAADVDCLKKLDPTMNTQAIHTMLSENAADMFT